MNELISNVFRLMFDDYQIDTGRHYAMVYPNCMKRYIKRVYPKGMTFIEYCDVFPSYRKELIRRKLIPRYL